MATGLEAAELVRAAVDACGGAVGLGVSKADGPEVGGADAADGATVRVAVTGDEQAAANTSAVART